jgi:hypothetical protein
MNIIIKIGGDFGDGRVGFFLPRQNFAAAILTPRQWRFVDH